MQYIDPVPFAVYSSGAAEPAATGETAWSAGAYAVGDKRYLASTHRIYKRLLAVGAGGGADDARPPSDFEGLDDGDPAKLWKEWAPTNRYAMFDDAVGSFTTAASPFVVELDPTDFVDSLALLDVSAATVRVQVLDGASVVYDTTVDMNDVNDVVDWYEYYFKPITRRTQVILTDLPPVTAARLRLSFTDTAAIRVGTCKPGRLQVIGETEWRPTVSLRTFSSPELDPETGITRVVSGPKARRINVRVECPTPAFDQVINALTALADRPVVWLGVRGQFETFNVFGFAYDWELELSLARKSFLSARIESL